jgi:Bacterial alpha-L-rhamnosidase 6 hairpin glycosidase domain
MRARLGAAAAAMLVVTLPSRVLWAQSDYAAAAMGGISDRGRNQDQPYVTAGDRAYLIGTQNGKFPDMGSHVPGEMGGLWLHPIKLIDGFWVNLTDRATNQTAALDQSRDFVTYPYGNRFSYGRPLDSLEVDRFQFTPDGQEGVVVQYELTNLSERPRQLQLQFAVKTELSPVWYSEHLGIKDTQDTVTWDAANRLFIAADAGNPWFAVWGATRAAEVRAVPHPAPIQTRGMGATAASRYDVSLQAHGTSTLTFVITGSATDRKEALDSYHYLAANYASLLAQKKAHYAALIDRARVRIPDRRWQEVYNWVRVNAEWLARDVPAIGRGLGGGLMEYPWWFGTETYSLQALMASGNVELARHTLRLLKEQSAKANGNGRIVHEVTTNGAVSNPGNSQETAQWILTAGRLIDWTGDLELAREMYPSMKQGLHWLLTDMDQNHDLFPEGYGIMEVYGLNAELIDVAVYTQAALTATARIAAFMNEPDSAARYRKLAAQLERRINQRFWNEREGAYADFFGTRAQAISAAEGAIKQIGLKDSSQVTARDRETIGYYAKLKQKFAAMPDTSRGWTTNKNWVITTPMETGIAPRVRAIRALDKIRKENVGEYGPYLSAVERQAMMTISTGVQAVSEGNYGRTQQALWYVDKIVQTFNRVTPGSISEMMPDYGCFTIAWTSYGVVVPLIQHVFGIAPDAVHQTVVIDPHPPAGWEEMSIEDLPVGATTISFARAKTTKGTEYSFEARDDGWRLIFKGRHLSGAKYYLNGKLVPMTSGGIQMTGRRNQILEVRSKE